MPDPQEPVGQHGTILGAAPTATTSSAGRSLDTDSSKEEKDADEDTPLAKYEAKGSKAELTKLILEG